MIKSNVLKEDFVKFSLYGNKVRVCINENEVEGIVYFDELMFPCFNKDALIGALIKANYPQDRMDAIRNNYDLVRDGTAGDKIQEYTEEYLAMQAWRRKAKELASEIMEEYEASQQSE